MQIFEKGVLRTRVLEWLQKSEAWRDSDASPTTHQCRSSSWTVSRKMGRHLTFSAPYLALKSFVVRSRHVMDLLLDSSLSASRNTWSEWSVQPYFLVIFSSGHYFCPGKKGRSDRIGSSRRLQGQPVPGNIMIFMSTQTSLSGVFMHTQDGTSWYLHAPALKPESSIHP